jgi:hypothetical protein
MLTVSSEPHIKTRIPTKKLKPVILNFDLTRKTALYPEVCVSPPRRARETLKTRYDTKRTGWMSAIKKSSRISKANAC